MKKKTKNQDLLYFSGSAEPISWEKSGVIEMDDYLMIPKPKFITKFLKRLGFKEFEDLIASPHLQKDGK